MSEPRVEPVDTLAAALDEVMPTLADLDPDWQSRWSTAALLLNVLERRGYSVGRAVQDDGLPTVEQLVDILDEAEGDGIIGPDYTPQLLADYILDALRAAPPLHDPQESLDPAGANNGPTWHNEPKDGWRP